MIRPFLIAAVSTLALGATPTQADVGFAQKLERGPGAGYNSTHYDRRVAQPKSILKGGRAHHSLQSERLFNQRLGSSTRATMRHRGDVARHARRGAETRATLARQAQPRVRFNTEPRRAGSGYNNQRYDRRVAQPKSILKGSRAHRAARSERAFTRNLGPSTRATMRHRGDVARHARKSAKYKSTLGRAGRTAKHARTARTLGKVAAGGIVAYGAQQALGVNVPDPISAAEWTYGTLKDPKNAGRRFEKLGRDSLREVDRGVRTLTNPKKMARNLERSANRTAKTVSKGACSVGKLFGAKC
ncbi:MAG: hypothetical protein AAF648_08740 [Pseudomonadota bacterium]